jgi:hypothetical protein
MNTYEKQGEGVSLRHSDVQTLGLVVAVGAG